MARKIIVGSRRSKLALTQTHGVIEQLKKAGSPYTFEVRELVTKGDRILDVTLSKVGGKGLFVKEIEQALLDGEIDMAVHSMKDMPAVLPDGLTIGCVPERVDVRDVLISKNGQRLKELRHGAVIGTSSLRRSAQLLAYRPDLTIQWIRGNVDTRIRKLNEENFDAIILAAAGLHRLAWRGTISEYIPVDICLPAVGQGALAIECRASDHELISLLQTMHHEASARAVFAEREVLRALEGGCQVPVAAYGRVNEQGQIELTALVATPDGKTVIKETGIGDNPVALGNRIATLLKERGAQEILDQAREENSRNG
jgi:hydroxymethylbilane synthase